MVPVVGGPLATFFAYMMSYSYNERMKLWLEDLASAVDELEETLEELTESPVFVDAVIHATRAAQATHQQQKLDALRNAVLNSVGADAPEVDEQARFFRLVEQFSPSHLRLLAFLRGGAAFEVGVMDEKSQALEDSMPEFRGKHTWYNLLVIDLANASLSSA